jgi:hypothetical protein
MQEMHRMDGFIARFPARLLGSHTSRRPAIEPHENDSVATAPVREDRLMRTRSGASFAWLLFGAGLLSTCTGCLIPMYSGDPIRRARQLIHTSEDLRAITDEWERIWFLDQPSHMKPYRTHGGIL